MTFTKDEWYDVAREINPETTREEFDRQWDASIKARDERNAKMRVQ